MKTPKFILSTITTIFIVSGVVYAISYPSTSPVGETTGGKFTLYFTKMFTTGCTGTNVVQSIRSDGTLTCVSGGGTFISGGGKGELMKAYAGRTISLVYSSTSPNITYQATVSSLGSISIKSGSCAPCPGVYNGKEWCTVTYPQDCTCGSNDEWTRTACVNLDGLSVKDNSDPRNATLYIGWPE